MLGTRRFTTLFTLFLAAAASSGLCQTGPGPEQDQTNSSAAQNSDTTIKVNVDLVNLFFTVREKKGGRIVPGLTQSDFKVLEDGKDQTIQRFSRETDLPLTLGLLIDISASQGR